MPRQRLNLNREWKFARGDPPGAEAVGFDDSSWEPVGLPHTFDLPYFRTPEFYVGRGWYRRRFEMRPEWYSSPSQGGAGGGSTVAPSGPHPPQTPPSREGGCKRLFLEFEGAFQDTIAYVNGRRVGRHLGGYTGFCFDITEVVQPGDNLIAVRVDNNWNPQLAPRAGEHIFSGGLYRDVYLVVKDELHVTWHGSFVTTPQVSAESAVANVKTEIRNDAAAERTCTLQTHIVDPDGRAVTMMESTQPIPVGRTIEFNQTSDTIPHPRLWHPDHPHLYTVRTQVHDEQGLVDEVESPLGFRWFEWTADRGFFLNGEHLYLRGANAHQDHAGWGIAITQAACWRDVRLIRAAGFNFVRGAHYPHHPAFAEACDRLGLLFWSENCFWGKGGFGPEGYWNASAYPVNPEDFEPFEESCRQALREMIRINHNHPSIIAWSMTNEAFFTYHLDRARALIADLVNLSHQLDPTRPAAIGGAQRGDVDKLGDVAGYNGDGARLFIDPGVPNMVSEYGAISKPHEGYDPYWGDLQTEQYSPPSREGLREGEAPAAQEAPGRPIEYPWRSGQAIWCGFDYGSIAGRQGLKGILDHARLPKRSWYWYRNAHQQIPPPDWPRSGKLAKLRLTADKSTIHGTDATDDCQIIVTVLDPDGRHIINCPPVTMTIESGPGEFPTGRSITFDPQTDIQIIHGQAAIAFRSYHGGRSVIRATSPGLQNASITITTEGDPGFVPGQTPLARPRPYVPPPLSQAAKDVQKNIVNVARDRPSRASSESPDHPARLANDGSVDTQWQADPRDANPWWQVDLEGFYQISGSRIVFQAAGNFRYIIELSEDGSNWTMAVDRSQSERTDARRNDIYPPGAVARYVQVTLTSVPKARRSGLAEVEVHGVLSVR